ncbi:hypothetical protein D3C81_1667510 [compost metagenome]
MSLIAWLGIALEFSSGKSDKLFPVEPLFKRVACARKARDVTGLGAKVVLQDLSEIVQRHVHRPCISDGESFCHHSTECPSRRRRLQREPVCRNGMSWLTGDEVVTNNSSKTETATLVE